MDDNLLKIYIICGIIFFILYLFKIILSMFNGGKAISSEAINPSIEIRHNELNFVNMYIDRCIIKTLFKYCNTNLNFAEGSSVKTLSVGSYRNCIDCLLRPNVLISKEDSFFTVFSTNVYMLFVSETANPIKQLIFKYWSGYDMSTYFDKKSKKKPSILPYINEYTRNYIWKLRNDNEEYDKRMFELSQNSTGKDANNYINQLNEYDKQMMKQLCLNLYNMNPSDGYNLSIVQNQSKNTNKGDKKE